MVTVTSRSLRFPKCLLLLPLMTWLATLLARTPLVTRLRRLTLSSLRAWKSGSRICSKLSTICTRLPILLLRMSRTWVSSPTLTMTSLLTLFRRLTLTNPTLLRLKHQRRRLWRMLLSSSSIQRTTQAMSTRPLSSFWLRRIPLSPPSPTSSGSVSRTNTKETFFRMVTLLCRPRCMVTADTTLWFVALTTTLSTFFTALLTPMARPRLGRWVARVGTLPRHCSLELTLRLATHAIAQRPRSIKL